MQRLEEVAIFSNKLTGELPLEGNMWKVLQNLGALKSCDLSQNNLSGDVVDKACVGNGVAPEVNPCVTDCTSFLGCGVASGFFVVVMTSLF